MSIDRGVINELARRLRKVRPPSYETRKIAADALDGLVNRIKELDELLERHPNWAMIEAAADDVRRAAIRAERERCLAVVRWVRALYPETAFPPDSDSRDAISGTWARKVCDNIVAQIEEAE